MSESETLYEQLGGREAIEAVVDRFYERVLDDDRLAYHFEDVEMRRLRAHQTAFISAATGGPVEYTGEGVREAHERLEITDEEFQAVTTHLRETLEEFEVRQDHIINVMVTVVDLRSEILGEGVAE